MRLIRKKVWLWWRWRRWLQRQLITWLIDNFRVVLRPTFKERCKNEEVYTWWFIFIKTWSHNTPFSKQPWFTCFIHKYLWIQRKKKQMKKPHKKISINHFSKKTQITKYLYSLPSRHLSLFFPPTLFLFPSFLIFLLSQRSKSPKSVYLHVTSYLHVDTKNNIL